MHGWRAPGSFRFAHQRRAFELQLGPDVVRARRISRILDSICADLDEGGTASIRQILRSPRELYRLELERPELGYQRITILDREALRALLARTPEESLRDRVVIR